MPLTRKGRKILRAMKREYGPERGERVFYASQSKGTIKGTHRTGRTTRRTPRKRSGLK